MSTDKFKMILNSLTKKINTHTDYRHFTIFIDFCSNSNNNKDYDNKDNTNSNNRNIVVTRI